MFNEYTILEGSIEHLWVVVRERIKEIHYKIVKQLTTLCLNAHIFMLHIQNNVSHHKIAANRLNCKGISTPFILGKRKKY